jgi:hypothetical protein
MEKGTEYPKPQPNETPSERQERFSEIQKIIAETGIVVYHRPPDYVEEKRKPTLPPLPPIKVKPSPKLKQRTEAEQLRIDERYAESKKIAAERAIETLKHPDRPRYLTDREGNKTKIN